MYSSCRLPVSTHSVIPSIRPNDATPAERSTMPTDHLRVRLCELCSKQDSIEMLQHKELR